MSRTLEIVPSEALPASMRQELCDLCSEAYQEPFAAYFADVGPGFHVLAREGDCLVSHAMWVTRWLAPAGQPPLRTAYVEAVATRPKAQKRGLASEVLRRLAHEVRDFDLAALSPSDEAFYARLGWQAWHGPLFVRGDAGLQPTPDEGVMILRLPRTPALDVTAALSVEWRPGELW